MLDTLIVKVAGRGGLMARDTKMEVGAINIRIPATHERDYVSLIAAIKAVKRGVNVRGDTYLAISNFDEKSKVGYIAKYTEIDLDGEWFDTGSFGTATPDAVDGVKVPKTLKPNLKYFRFYLDEAKHVVVFETYADSAYVSCRAVESYFDSAVSWREISGKFGRVASSLVMSHEGARKLLSLPNLKEVHITIRPPNSDDVGDDLASVIEKRLAEQGGDELQEILIAKGKHNLKPNERTKKLASLAAENGELMVKSLVNGVKKPHSLSDTPLLEVAKYSASRASEPMFFELVNRLLAKITTARGALRG